MDDVTNPAKYKTRFNCRAFVPQIHCTEVRPSNFQLKSRRRGAGPHGLASRRTLLSVGTSVCRSLQMCSGRPIQAAQVFFSSLVPGRKGGGAGAAGRDSLDQHVEHGGQGGPLWRLQAVRLRTREWGSSAGSLHPGAPSLSIHSSTGARLWELHCLSVTPAS